MFGELGSTDDLSEEKEQLTIVNKLVAKATAIVHFFRKSPLAARDLRDHQAPPYHKLRPAIRTRWGSILDMLTRLYENRGAVTTCLQAIHETPGRDKPPPNLTEEEWPIIAALIALLKPFQVATLSVSAQNGPTISLLPRILHLLQHHLKAQPQDQQLVTALKSVLREQLNKVMKRWEGIDDILHLAPLLDPRTKVANLFSVSVTLCFYSLRIKYNPGL